MNEDIKIKWLAALRSGEYQQTKEALRAEGSFCCLGVLCDIVEPDDWEHDFHRGRNSYPADALLAEYGLTRSALEPYARMNDAGESFIAIADRIEKDL